MTLLDTFIMAFGTEGLGEVAKEISETERKVDALEKEEKKLNETIKKGGEEADKAKERLKKINEELPKTKNHLKELKGSTEGIILQLKNVAGVAAKIGGSFIALKKATNYTEDFVGNVLEVADAAEKAKKSLEDYQKETYGRVIFSKDDVSAAKEYEMVQRDIRAGMAQIGSNLAQLLLPAMTAIAKVTSKVIDFFTEHGVFIKALLVGIGVVMTAFLIPQIIKLGVALWTALAPVIVPVLAVTAALVALALVFEDLWKWMHGEPSVAELLFGDFETVKNNVLTWWENLKTAFIDGFNAIKDFLTPIFNTIGAYLKSYLNLWMAIFNFIAAKLAPIIKAIGDAIGKIASIISEKLQPVLNSVGEFFKWLLNIVKEIGLAIISAIPDWFKKILEGGGKVIKIATDINNAAANKINGSHALGLDYVPFDGYIAELHKGERVQTASEAQNWRSGLMAAQKAINFTASYPLNAIPSGAISNAYSNSTNSKTINIGDITIHTQATDAQGIAGDIASYIKQAVIDLDDGMLA